MRSFDYVRADSIASAVASSQTPAARFIAGGTNLLDLMKLEIETPERLVDINRLPLGDVGETTDGGLSIGALVRNSDLAADRLVRRRYAVLARALLAGASGQLRNRATTGGNLLQRTRCPYFYEPSMACNKRRPGEGCSAIGGYTRNHALLGASAHCIATHPSDMAVALMALDARILTDDGKGKREIPLADFYLPAGDTPHLETVLHPGELIVAIMLPPPPPGRQIYRKVRDRASYAFALVSIAALVAVEDGRIASARLAFGGIGYSPWRDREVEALLVGEAPSPALFDRAADRLLATAQGQGGNDFKIPLTRRTLAAVLATACGGVA
jgi:xanthine dehydrogenase YagS FAD-binding subunit